MHNLHDDLPEYTLPSLLFRAVEKYGDIRAVFAPHNKPIIEMTYKQVADEVVQVGAGLLRSGVLRGDHIALFSDNEPRWLIIDLAITGIGAVDVPRGSDTSVSEYEFIIEHSGAQTVVLQNRKLYDRLAGSVVFQNLKRVILLDDSDVKPVGTFELLTYNAVKEAGSEGADTALSEIKKTQPDDLATIVYTSGTTGSPKGVMLTHRNLMTQPNHVDLGYTPQPGEIQLSILPSWHAYERATEYFGLNYGTTLTYSDKKYIREDLLKLCPQLLPCVPRIWESVYKAIYSKLGSAPPKKQKMFKFFVNAGFKYIYARRLAGGFSPLATNVSAFTRLNATVKQGLLYPVYKLGDMLVFSKLRQITGGRLRAAVSGGGSLAPYLDDFFEVLDIPILNGYGSTETSPVITVRRTDNNIRGTVGTVIKQTEISIRDDKGQDLPTGAIGEIWARGPQVMQGYYNNPEATSKVLKKDGWFATGDLGRVTTQGQLVITGRAKDTIVLSSGENVEPEPIEDTCRQSPLVQQIHLVGQDEKTLGALIVPEYQAVASALNLSGNTSHEEIANNPEAEKLLKQELQRIMTTEGRFKAIEFISKIALLAEPFTEANGMLTNTMKIKRNVVNEKYRDRIQKLFQ